jgi:hypothetical protein
MRETCARVLAAALMTGAIAFAVGMPALFGTAQDLGRSFVAPPSSLQRTVHARPFAAESRTRGSEHHVEATAGRPSRVVAFDRKGVSPAQHRRGAGKPAAPVNPKPRPPAPAPAPSPPAPQVGTRELASVSSPPAPAPEPRVTPRPAERPARHPHPNTPKGKAKGHDRGNTAQPTPTAAQTSSTTSAATAPAAAPSSTACQPQQEATTDHDNGQGHGNGNAAGAGNGNGGGNGNGKAKGHEG